MKILFTGGGSGGHFYPIIAIAEQVLAIASAERLITPQLFFMAPEPYDQGLLYEHAINFIRVPTGKARNEGLSRNAVDAVRTVVAVLRAVWKVWTLYPDVVVGKGGYGSFPALFAARFWKIPVLIHESDTVPGRVNAWAGKFAARIALSFPQAAASFPEGRVAHTGNPLRSDIVAPRTAASRGDFGLADGTKTIFVIGGSLGSQRINEVVLQTLPELLKDYEVIHQTGKENLSDIVARSKVLLQEHPRKGSYHPVGYLATEKMAAAGMLSDLIISRSGSTLFEIAAWGKPSLLIPLPEAHGDHQRENAYAYAETGAADVLEESNLTVTILLNEVRHILNDELRRTLMAERARRFAKTDAAAVIAREVLDIALSHERSA